MLVVPDSLEMAMALLVLAPQEQAVTGLAAPGSLEMALVVLVLLEPAATALEVPGLREMVLVAQASLVKAGMVLALREKVETAMVLVLTVPPEQPEMASRVRTVKALMVQGLPEKVEMAQVSRAALTEKVTVALVE